jgi:hypothetical protein
MGRQEHFSPVDLGAAKDTNYILEFLKPLLNSKNKLAESKF